MSEPINYDDLTKAEIIAKVKELYGKTIAAPNKPALVEIAETVRKEFEAAADEQDADTQDQETAEQATETTPDAAVEEVDDTATDELTAPDDTQAAPTEAGAKQGDEVAEEIFSYEGGDRLIREYITRFLKSAEKRDFANGAKALSSAMQTLLRRPTDENMTFMYNFFADERYADKQLAENKVFQGVTRLSVKERNQLETFYTLFREAVGEGRKLNMELARKVLSTDVINWFIKKSKNK